MRNINRGRRIAGQVALALAGVVAVSAPIVVSIASASALQSESQAATSVPSAPEFDVASVKPTTFRFHRPMDSLEQVCWTMRCRWSDRLFARDAPLPGLIQMAYDVWGHQIVGLPGWVDSARYEIDARAGGAGFQQMRAMMRAPHRRRSNQLHGHIQLPVGRFSQPVQ